MTREEAILTLKVAQEYFDKNVPALGGEAMRMAIDALQNINDLRNELCLKCGKYKDAHLGACDGCRWRKDVD